MNQRRVNGALRSTGRAFTLLEVMLVIVIIAILAGVVVTNVMNQGEKAKKQATELKIKNIEQALDLFKLDIGRYPTTEEGLIALNAVDPIQDEDLAKKWAGPYAGADKGDSVKKEFKLQDTWNHDFHYKCPGEHNTKTFDLSSDGPDGQEGTDDDLVNWETEK
ncbi:MAG: type II secretion system major pseudopilin GspG [Phycisphaerae bacterium]